MANFNFNKVILGGRLCAKPELKQTKSGVIVTDITVAVNRRYVPKGNTDTSVGGDVPGAPSADFIKVILWRQTAEFVCKYFDKGSSICIVGSIQTRSWTDKQGNKQYATEVVADEVHFVDSKSEGGGGYQMPSDADAPPARGGETASSPPPAYYTPEGGNAPQFETIADDEELPF